MPGGRAIDVGPRLPGAPDDGEDAAGRPGQLRHHRLRGI